MNRKSELHKLLEYKPIINPNTDDFFFDTHGKEDRKFMSKFYYNQIWTWMLVEDKDILTSGYWLVNRNAYVITEKPVPEDRVFPNDITFQLLPRDFSYLDELAHTDNFTTGYSTGRLYE